MKIIKSKKVKKSYEVLLKVSDKDIENIEDLAWCINEGEEGKRLERWLQKMFKEFQKLWKKYD